MGGESLVVYTFPWVCDYMGIVDYETRTTVYNSSQDYANPQQWGEPATFFTFHLINGLLFIVFITLYTSVFYDCYDDVEDEIESGMYEYIRLTLGCIACRGGQPSV